MAQATNTNRPFKCPHCACIFLTELDLQKHLAVFGEKKESHDFSYRKIHGRLEHGYGEE